MTAEQVLERLDPEVADAVRRLLTPLKRWTGYEWRPVDGFGIRVEIAPFTEGGDPVRDAPRRVFEVVMAAARQRYGFKADFDAERRRAVLVAHRP